MEFDKFTERSRGFIQSAQGLALRSNHQQFKPEHVLKVLLDDKEGLAASLIAAAGGDYKRAAAAVEAELAKEPKVEGGSGQIYLASETARLFEVAQEISQKAGDEFVTAEKLLLALSMAEGTAAAKALKDAGVTPQSMNKAITELRKGRTANSATAEDSYDALKKYTHDLTAAAREGKIDPVIGRDEEIR
ncbi:MAG: ATP-dependent chaperone ClpB, partial [Rhodospirillaceae bacterium]|nr:ATP-dependent chaperone ClpB [Rhodospirillaceae bacterium]